MATRTWKCVPCGKAFKTAQAGTVGPKCPACGKPLSAVGAPAGGLRFPTPQPRAVPRHEASPATTRRRPVGRTMPVIRQPVYPRPTDPAEALAGMCPSSGVWEPDPEPGSSSDSRVVFATGPFQPRVPEFAQARGSDGGRPEWVKSPWTWASVGGVVVAVTFTVVFFVNFPMSAVARGTAAGEVAGPGAAMTLDAGVVTRTVDLLPYVDVDRDTLGGTWRLEDRALRSDASHKAKLGIHYPVPREYDFRVEFTQVDGDNCAVQMFTSGNPGALVLGGWKRSVTGFQQLAGRWANNNPTGVRGLRWENGRRHTSVVRVRKGSIEAWLDGKLITAYATDGSDLSNKDWDVPGYPLGVGSEVSSTVFHKVEIIEIDVK